MYKNKPKIFDSFCWHYDEVENLPSETKVLSSNEKSSIQSIVFSRDKSEIWAVQYHPEFDPKWISGLMKQRNHLLLKEGIYQNSEEFNQIMFFIYQILKNIKIKKINYQFLTLLLIKKFILWNYQTGCNIL